MQATGVSVASAVVQYQSEALGWIGSSNGDSELLKCIPNPGVLSTYRVQVDKSEISFEIVGFYSDAQRVKQEADSIIGYIREQSGHLDANIRQFNQSLPDLVKRTFNERKAKLLQHRQAAASLGVPIRKNPNVPATFAVPATVRKVVAPKPSIRLILDPRCDWTPTWICHQVFRIFCWARSEDLKATIRQEFGQERKIVLIVMEAGGDLII